MQATLIPRVECSGAYWLFSLGLLGAGMLGVPVLAGSCAYAIAEAADWVGSLDVHPPLAHGFYAVIAVAMALGLGLDYAGLDAVKMLFWAAVLNGALAPPLLILVVLLTSRVDVMGEHRNGPLLRWLGWMCAVVMPDIGFDLFAAARQEMIDEGFDPDFPPGSMGNWWHSRPARFLSRMAMCAISAYCCGPPSITTLRAIWTRSRSPNA